MNFRLSFRYEFQFLQFARLIFSCNCGTWKLQPNPNETKWRTEVAGGWIRKIRGMRNLSRRRHAMFQKFPCKRNKHTLSLGILPRQINQWFLTSYESLNSMWGKLNEIWSDLLWASSALCFPADLRQRRIFDHSCGIWKVQLQNMRQPRWVTRFFSVFG